MVSQFLNFIEDEDLFYSNEKILLGVSGGMDSVTMCELFYRCGFNFALAHCNYKLREKESDEDEIFVKNLADAYEVEFYTQSFNTIQYGYDNKMSIQMAARELRYDWFERIRSEHRYSYIAVAHHRDDVMETFMINLLRGTGIAGLHGISPKNGNIIRPLLFANRYEIDSFIKHNRLKYREDSSNKSLKYLRNKIRHTIIPLFKEINPRIQETIFKEIERIRSVEDIFIAFVNDKRNKIVKNNGNYTTLKIKELLNIIELPTVLFEFLKPFNFSPSIVKDIVRSLEGIPGKRFYSPTHFLVKDREFLIVTPIDNKEIPQFVINEDISPIDDGILHIKFSKIEISSGFTFPKNLDIAYLDFDKLKFPLTIRKWEKGDWFVPFGMTSKKKLSDFFIDKKLSIIEKEQVRVVSSGKDIVWVIGLRIDNRYKISENTKNVLRIDTTK